MQNPVVVIGGLEKSYMQKLALYLNTRIGKDGYVELLEGSDRQIDSVREDMRKTLGTGSRFGSVCGGFAGSGTGRTDSDPY